MSPLKNSSQQNYLSIYNFLLIYVFITTETAFAVTSAGERKTLNTLHWVCLTEA